MSLRVGRVAPLNWVLHASHELKFDVNTWLLRFAATFQANPLC